MIPDSTTTLLVFFLLVAPGLAYGLMRERRRPSQQESAFREASVVVLSGAIFSFATLAGLVLAQANGIAALPDVSIWISRGSGYVRDEYARIALALTAQVGISVLLAALVARLQGGEGRISGVSTWYKVFRKDRPDKDHYPYIAVTLTNGQQLLGRVADYTTEQDADNREMILSPPIFKRGSGETSVEEVSAEWQRLIIPASSIQSAFVSYRPKSQRARLSTQSPEE